MTQIEQTGADLFLIKTKSLRSSAYSASSASLFYLLKRTAIDTRQAVNSR